MDANLKQQWYERVTRAKLLAEHKEQLVLENLKLNELDKEELSSNYAALAGHRSTILATTSLFSSDGRVKANKHTADLLLSASLYWDAKALQYWILAREDMNAERNATGNINKQKQAKANARAFKKWRKKFLKFKDYVEELEGV